jgi:hypothetical protein
LLIPITLKGFSIMQTRHRQFGVIVAFGLLLLVAGRVSAQNNITVDEYGNGFLNGNPLPFVPSAVETTFSGQATLLYQLPFFVVRGDVILNDGPVIGDILRFDNNTAGGLLYFFSDPPETGENPVPFADKGIPPPSPLPAVNLLETGVEGNDGAFYGASGNSPGSQALAGGTAPVNYTIISDGTAVPEPSTFALLGAGGLALAARAWRKRRLAESLRVRQLATRPLGAILICLMTLVANSVSAQSVQLDEWGNGTSGGNPIPSSIGVDPTSGTATLVYQLPFRVIPGDVVLSSTSTAGNVVSDIVRFDNNAIGGLAYFFSDLPDENPAPPADVGIPSINAAQNPIFLNEIGPEGSNGAFYVPGSVSDPGFNTNGVTATYNIISDSAPVPEPSAFALLGAGTILMLGFGWQRQKQAPPPNLGTACL